MKSIFLGAFIKSFFVWNSNRGGLVAERDAERALIESQRENRKLRSDRDRWRGVAEAAEDSCLERSKFAVELETRNLALKRRIHNLEFMLGRGVER